MLTHVYLFNLSLFSIHLHFHIMCIYSLYHYFDSFCIFILFELLLDLICVYVVIKIHICYNVVISISSYPLCSLFSSSCLSAFHTFIFNKRCTYIIVVIKCIFFCTTRLFTNLQSSLCYFSYEVGLVMVNVFSIAVSPYRYIKVLLFQSKWSLNGLRYNGVLTLIIVIEPS